MNLPNEWLMAVRQQVVEFIRQYGWEENVEVEQEDNCIKIQIGRHKPINVELQFDELGFCLDKTITEIRLALARYVDLPV